MILPDYGGKLKLSRDDDSDSDEETVDIVMFRSSLLTSDSVFKRGRGRGRKRLGIGGERGLETANAGHSKTPKQADGYTNGYANGGPPLTQHSLKKHEEDKESIQATEYPNGSIHDTEIESSIEQKEPLLNRSSSTWFSPLSRTSSQNPFFGYKFLPTFSYSAWVGPTPTPSSSLPTPQTSSINDSVRTPSSSNNTTSRRRPAGNIYRPSFLDAQGRPSRRRRVAELVYTLARMYIQRWGRRVLMVLFGVLVLLVVRRRRRRGVVMGG